MKLNAPNVKENLSIELDRNNNLILKGIGNQPIRYQLAYNVDPKKIAARHEAGQLNVSIPKEHGPSSTMVSIR